MGYTYRSGFFWLFIFFLFAVLPLIIGLAGEVPDARGFWVEFGVTLGFLGLAMMGLQPLFSGRFRKIAPTFGMDNILQFHREIGIIAIDWRLIYPERFEIV